MYATDVPGRSVVAALDPEQQLKLAGRKDLEPLAKDVRQRLARVLERVAA